MELEELSVVEKAAMLSGGSEWDSRGNAREAPLMEELLLETAEEPLRGRVVRRTAFRAHRTRQTMLLADADPLGPPVVAATVGMDDWFLPVLERGAHAASMPLANAAFGLVPIVHATGSPS